MGLDKYEQKLLNGWEDVAKKGQLTLWIMLALKDGPKHMSEIKVFIDTATNGTMSADDQSMYRALRRYYDAEMITYIQASGKGGPDLKIYSLTQVGSKILHQFIQRNIVSVFFTSEVKKLLQQ